jgi:hypothetical protein
MTRLPPLDKFAGPQTRSNPRTRARGVEGRQPLNIHPIIIIIAVTIGFALGGLLVALIGYAIERLVL